MLNDAARTWQLSQLRKMIAILAYLVRQTSQQEATTYRDGGDGWTAAEVLGHLLDYEAIFLERARLMVENEGATLPNPDPDELVRTAGYNHQDIHSLYERWRAGREQLLAYLDERNENDWSRTGQHPKRGPFTLEQQLLLCVWHDTNHLEQICHTLATRQ